MGWLLFSWLYFPLILKREDKSIPIFLKKNNFQNFILRNSNFTENYSECSLIWTILTFKF